ncbi:hypothetical protein OKA05_03895 [Luteolibacter arcticus]|uniref:Uncharacterized protein n=1 Tax=Luteolibacter arcticus TaxID=1581411 RepID=A0ABT3GE15_9BACT|nr:hypothetical protein [Luteolibacter arcticus]MCW1921681.1 hypothetical protein [Luteolibacter arcticus]
MKAYLSAMTVAACLLVLLMPAHAETPKKAVPAPSAEEAKHAVEEAKRAVERAMDAMGAALVQANAATRQQHEALQLAKKAGDGKTVPAVDADAELVTLAAKDAKALEPLLKDDWVVEVKQHEIVLTSKFEVFRESLHRPLNEGMPEFSDAVSREELLTHGAPEKYVFRLEYARALTREEYEKRLTGRQGAALAMALGPWSKHEGGVAYRLLDATRVPRYRSFMGGGAFHIYESNSDLFSGRLYPPASVRKIGAAKAILAEELRLMPSATDASAVE